MAVILRDATTPSQQLVIDANGNIAVRPTKRTKAVCWTVDQFAPTSASEALLTVTESLDGAATTTFTSKVLTSGKIFHISSIFLAYEAGGTTMATLRPIYVALRFNTAGAVTASSPMQLRLAAVWGGSAVTTAPSIVGAGTAEEYGFGGDGLEFIGDGTKQIGLSAIAPGWVTTTTLPKLTLSLVGYEY